MADQNRYPFQKDGSNTLSESTRLYVYSAATSLGIELTQEETEHIANSVMHTLTTTALKACKTLE